MREQPLFRQVRHQGAQPRPLLRPARHVRRERVYTHPCTDQTQEVQRLIPSNCHVPYLLLQKYSVLVHSRSAAYGPSSAVRGNKDVITRSLLFALSVTFGGVLALTVYSGIPRWLLGI